MDARLLLWQLHALESLSQIRNSVNVKVHAEPVCQLFTSTMAGRLTIKFVCKLAPHVWENDFGKLLKLYKTKRPGGVFSFDVQFLVEDDYGVWLYSPVGSEWMAPHDEGVLLFGALLLIRPDRYWAAWWVDYPNGRRLEIDVCLRPERVVDGWAYVDLELDAVRHADGTIEIEDRDEFDIACSNGWITVSDGKIAELTANAMAAALREREEPFGIEGWQRLDALLGKGEKNSS